MQHTNVAAHKKLTRLMLHDWHTVPSKRERPNKSIFGKSNRLPTLALRVIFSTFYSLHSLRRLILSR